MNTTTYNSLSKKLRTVLLNGLVLMLTLFMLQACDDDDDDNGPTNPPNETGNIVEVAQSDDDFSDLVSALSDAGLVATLEGDGPFTVFAPTNDAFADLDVDLSTLTEDQLVEVLTYHVLDAEVASGDLDSAQTVATVSGGEIFITVEGSDVRVNDRAMVTSADIEASNGTIHAIDQVLLPDGYTDIVAVIAKRYDLQSLETAVVDAGLAGTLQGDGPFTVFAPTNEAFKNADLSGYNVEDVLTYHVLGQEVLSGDIQSGTVTTVNGAELEITVNNDNSVSLTDQAGNTFNVITVDLQGTNGVVHIIDGVLLPS